MNIEKLKAAALAANQAWMDEPYEIEPALVLELIERLEAAEKRLAYRDEECVIITKKQLRVWLDDRDDGSIDWRGENEV